ncbi:MAG TPA: hypothetical protein VLI91_15155, partial [Roseiarcus sp.]|nr:hypothetical protein [Roseiarcus sp.]
TLLAVIVASHCQFLNFEDYRQKNAIVNRSNTAALQDVERHRGAGGFGAGDERDRSQTRRFLSGHAGVGEARPRAGGDGLR